MLRVIAVNLVLASILQRIVVFDLMGQLSHTTTYQYHHHQQQQKQQHSSSPPSPLFLRPMLCMLIKASKIYTGAA
ncbi:hypothetical protein BDD12DRAFT_865769 [Trichophaea hybrida]|nr:hypothetical protein BDD12DRAFT_865769 [Trichophaea hybrida]